MTVNEAQLLANVQARSERLFEDGYCASLLDEYTVEVTNDEGTSYEVDTLFETCTCPFYREHNGRYPCKHVLGYERLLERQEEARGRRRAEATQP